MGNQIFVGNLPVHMHPDDLYLLVGRLGESLELRIHTKTTMAGRTVRYGVARAPARRIVRAAATSLLRRRIGSRTVIIRDFIRRTAANERRAVGWRSLPWHAPEHRCAERRAY